MRGALDRLYLGALWLSGLCLVAIAALVLAQIAGRVLDAALKFAGRPPAGFIILSLSEIAGYLLAAATCLALAGTLKAGAHIRMTMLLGAVGENRRWLCEIPAFAASAAFSGYMTHFIARLAWDSWMFNEISPGLVPVPLVWPQAAMAAGLLVLTVAILDELIVVVRTGRPSFRRLEDAVALGKEG